MDIILINSLRFMYIFILLNKTNEIHSPVIFIPGPFFRLQ